MRRNRTRRWGWAIGAALVMCGTWLWVARTREDEKEKALAHAEGIPTSYREFPLHAPVAVTDNAAVDYRAAATAFVSSPVYRNYSASDKASKAVIDHLAFESNREAIADLMRGCRKPSCDFDYRFPGDLPQSSQNDICIRILVRLTAAEAAKQAAEGHPLQGLALLRGIGGAAGHIADASPTLDSLYRAVACVNTVSEGVQQILYSHGLDPGVAEAASDAIRTINCPVDLAATMEFETLQRQDDLVSTSALRTAWRNSGVGWPQNMVAASYVPGMINLWRANQWRLVRAEVAAVRQCGEDWVELDRRLERAYMQATAGPEGLYTRYTGWNPTWIATGAARVIAIRRVTLAAAAVLIRLRDDGRLPNSLPIDGAESIDPRTGKPLRYAREPNGFQVIGTGDRGIDFQGRVNDMVRFSYMFGSKVVHTTTEGKHLE